MALKPAVLIIGANRGLGLEWTRQWLHREARVYATARQPKSATDLHQLQEKYPDQLSIHQVDVSRDRNVDALGEELQDTPLNILIHNAGVMGKKGLDSLDTDEVLNVLNINSVGALRTVRTFRPHLKESEGRSKIALITSLMGSIADNRSGGSYAYRMSKAALNMAGKSMAVDLSGEKIDVMILHPGWVRTDMGGPAARIDVQTSVEGMMTMLDKLDPSLSGTFWHSNGKELPW